MGWPLQPGLAGSPVFTPNQKEVSKPSCYDLRLRRIEMAEFSQPLVGGLELERVVCSHSQSQAGEI